MYRYERQKQRVENQAGYGGHQGELVLDPDRKEERREQNYGERKVDAER